MVNVNKLRGKIVERGLNVESLANMLSMNKSTLYRHLNGGGEGFSIKEANAIAQALDLNYDELMDIFFSSSVA